jgi:hypothetical protein
MARYHGRHGVVYMSATGSGTAINVISLSSWELNMATDVVEVTAFGDANKVYVQGLKDLTGTINGFWDSADDTMFDAADSADGVKLYLYPSSDAPTVYFYGPAWVDASITTGVSAAIGVSCNFRANGSWGRKPA